jgi:uncharacterized membrane protein (UPF0127 family)
LLLLALVACTGPASLDGFETTTIEVGDQTLTVALAETADQRSQGLRGVEELPEGLDGMLFVFEQPRTATFGMGDTLIPLDIWWFDADGALVGSTEMTPCAAEPCTAYGSPGEVAHALETPAGELELAPGDVLNVETP